MDCSSPGSSVHGIFQARILERVATSFSRDLPDPGTEPGSPALAGGFFTTSHTFYHAHGGRSEGHNALFSRSPDDFRITLSTALQVA